MMTMKDIAALAKVSRPTVSAILNDREAVGISVATRERVLEAARSLGYRRNELARAVVTGKNRMIGYLAPTPHKEHIARMLVGAVDALNEYGYTVKLLRVQEETLDRNVVHQCVELCLSGVIVVHPCCQEWIDYVHEELSRRSIPIAIVDSSLRYPWAIRVITDDESGGYAATRHLIDLGHRRIAFIGGIGVSPVTQLRKAGYERALLEASLPLVADDMRLDGWDALATDAAVRDVLGKPEQIRPTAVFCASDEVALVVLRSARRLGLRLPRDLSVVGYGNLANTDLADPALTTVEQPFEEVGQAAVRLLINAVDGAKVPSAGMPEEIIATKLVIRDSSDAVAFAAIS